MDAGISPSSSRNSVPPEASSNKPCLRLSAPVNAPFSWPNSSLSSRDSGIAPTLTGTKGPCARLLRRCMSRATTSLPVPLSPVMSTVEFVGATRVTRSYTFFITGEPLSRKASSRSASRLPRFAIFSNDAAAIALFRRRTSSAGSKGFTR